MKAAIRFLLLAGTVFFARHNSIAVEPRGVQFIGFTNFSAFSESAGANSSEVVLTSPEIVAGIPWNELIASWNAAMPTDATLKVEARAIYQNHTTKYFKMGLWSANRQLRASVPNQKDDDGDVATDTLLLTKQAKRFQIRLTLSGAESGTRGLKYFGICVRDIWATSTRLPPNRSAWGKLLDVPERSQMGHLDGETLCSPAVISMMLAHWSRILHRPDLDRAVPDVANGVFDVGWGGTGNWAFNTAFAGSLPGMRACVARLSDVSELEDWIARGIPVGLSVCYNRLRGKDAEPSGHLVVCVGFTDTGDVIINDPGTSQKVRKIFPRENLIRAWAYSQNTVYLIYPEVTNLPKDRFDHWDSKGGRKNASAAK